MKPRASEQPNRRDLTAALVVALAVAVAARAQDEPAARMIGWRGDGTGVFPPDCRVVAQWSETQNLLWRTPLPNAGNGSPICVGRKVFVMCEPGWKSDAPVLVCVDADGGRLLWQREVDHFDLLPPGEREQAQQHRARWFELFRKGMRYTVQIHDGPKEQAPQLQARMEAEGLGKYGFGQIRFDAHHAWVKGFRESTNWPKPTWGWLPIGTTFATPVSDGRRVYVVTAFNVVACYDLDGARKWMQWFRTDKLAYHEVARFAHSPLLAEGRLVVEGNIRLRCFDPATGRLLWDVPTSMQLYMVGTPVVLRVPGPAGDDPVPVVCTCSGEVVRLSDGRLLAGKIGLFANGAGFVGDGRDTIFGVNGRAGGHYKATPDRKFAVEHERKLIAVRLRFEGADKVEPELLWTLGYGGGEAPVYHRGVIVKGDSAVDARTGKLIRQVRSRGPRPDQGWILAGGLLLGTNHAGQCAVVEAATLRPVGVNQLNPIEPRPSAEKVQQMSGLANSLKTGSWYVWNFGRSLPFASGNRLFLRSFDYLYAVGVRGQAFRPSKAYDVVE